MKSVRIKTVSSCEHADENVKVTTFVPVQRQRRTFDQESCLEEAREVLHHLPFPILCRPNGRQNKSMIILKEKCHGDLVSQNVFVLIESASNG